ncbi:hypothetical protein MKX47_08980 [Solibacillus sp. FSL R7-0668]|uniref:hypothetical protein n=1 Tax=Solibacillus sp. FSL R7-0668 TaxID=2921688 RepID=UPI0030F97577
MKPIFLHLHNMGFKDWLNKVSTFERIPVEGEYLTIDYDSDLYKVEMVIHTPFSEEMCAEVYAVKVNHIEELNLKLNNNN